MGTRPPRADPLCSSSYEVSPGRGRGLPASWVRQKVLTAAAPHRRPQPAAAPHAQQASCAPCRPAPALRLRRPAPNHVTPPHPSPLLLLQQQQLEGPAPPGSEAGVGGVCSSTRARVGWRDVRCCALALLSSGGAEGMGGASSQLARHRFSSVQKPEATGMLRQGFFNNCLL